MNTAYFPKITFKNIFRGRKGGKKEERKEGREGGRKGERKEKRKGGREEGRGKEGKSSSI